MYTAWVMYGDWFKDVYFPDQKSWNRKIILLQGETGLEYDLYISVRSLDDRIWVCPVAPLSWKEGGRKEREAGGNAVFSLMDPLSSQALTVTIKSCQKQWLRFTKYVLPQRMLTVGREDSADIQDTSKLISLDHGFLGFTQDGYVRYQDKSTNGTYLNGRKMLGGKVKLEFGDVIALPTGLKILYLGACIAINRTATSRVNRLEKWHAQTSKRSREPEDRELPSVFQDYQRIPRMLEPCEAEDVDVEPPIAKENTNDQPLILQIGPSMTMVLPMLMGTVFASNRSGLLSSGLVMIGTSSALAVMWGLLNRNYRKKKEVEKENLRVGMYQRYIMETEQILKNMNEKEQRRLMDTFPNVAQCADLPKAENHQMWNRMPLHADFLHVRVGTGTVDMPCSITVPKEKLSLIDDNLRKEPERLKKTYSVIHNAPVTLPLRNEAVIGILGGVRARLFAQGLLMQIAALHSYHDVRIAVLTEEGSLSSWAWARWLPHVFASEDRQLRMVASNPGDVHDVVSHLEEILMIRKSNAEESGKDREGEDVEDAPPLPHYVIFCTNYRILEDEVIMRQLLTNHQGMTLIMLGENMTSLPKECHLVLDLEGGKGHIYSREGMSQEVEFEYPDKDLMRSFSRMVAPIRLRDVAENAAIPTLVSFLDIYGVRRTEDLEVWRMWTENHAYDGLKSVIGYRAGSQPFTLDISERFHGPHGLIAGTTGSGKSVMLETYILSLALNYSPREVRFILIDYKGGGMADSFRDLPHVAGIIDNLQGPRIIDRALASLNGEIHRRERIFKETQVNNINDYTRQFNDIPGKEMPHLIIIVDEFAELKSEQPEFMGELVSASRVGRSLGIHLILATQKPSNSVSDEIWANSRFHLCLRVQTRQDSMEMLKRPDAAYIKGMGRCFIQIGNDEEFYQVQTSYSGLDYKPDEPREEEMPQLLNGVGHVVPVARRAKTTEKVPSQMDATLVRIQEVAAEHGLSESQQLWLPELPQYIYLRDMELFRRATWDGKIWPNPAGDILIPIGMADDVENQQYIPFTVNLTQNRNLLIVGLAGTGKTTLVQSMVYSLCSLYDPEHLQIYVLSLTSQTLRNMTAFPQVGDIAFDGEVLEMKRFLNMLFEELTRRTNLFAAAATDSFVEYNAALIKRGEKPEPAIVVFVDRYMQLREMFSNDDFYTARLQTLLQEGSGRGIHFIVTALANNEVPMRVRPGFGGMALRLKERADYTECLGKSVPYDMPPIAQLNGRGMGIMDGKIYEIQFAMGSAAPEHAGVGMENLASRGKYILTHALEEAVVLTDVDRAEHITAYARRQDSLWQGSRPRQIPRLPQNATWETLSTNSEFESMNQEPFALPIGYDMVRGTLAALHTESAPSWAVYGPRRSGITNFLKLMAKVMTVRGADVHILADSNWTGLARELNSSLYITPEEIVAFLQLFIEKYAAPRKTQHDEALSKGKSAAIRQAAQFKPCCILIDNAERLYGEFSKESNKKNLPLVQGLLSEIMEKPYYNFTMFAGFSSAERMACSNEPLRTLVAQGRAIALGGKLMDFDPCNVGAGFNSKARSAALPIGQGFAGNNGVSLQVVIPLAEEEEE